MTVRDIRPRAELCIKMGSGHFKSQFKKYKRGAVEERKYLEYLPM